MVRGQLGEGLQSWLLDPQFDVGEISVGDSRVPFQVPEGTVAAKGPEQFTDGRALASA